MIRTMGAPALRVVDGVDHDDEDGPVVRGPDEKPAAGVGGPPLGWHGGQAEDQRRVAGCEVQDGLELPALAAGEHQLPGQQQQGGRGGTSQTPVWADGAVRTAGLYAGLECSSSSAAAAPAPPVPAPPPSSVFLSSTAHRSPPTTPYLAASWPGDGGRSGHIACQGVPTEQGPPPPLVHVHLHGPLAWRAVTAGEAREA